MPKSLSKDLLQKGRWEHQSMIDPLITSTTTKIPGGANLTMAMLREAYDKLGADEPPPRKSLRQFLDG